MNFYRHQSNFIIEQFPSVSLPNEDHTLPMFAVETRDGLTTMRVTPNSTQKTWTVFEIAGPFDFEQFGILVQFLEPLAEAKIPALTYAAYSTDYIAVPTERAEEAISQWQKANHHEIKTALDESNVRDGKTPERG